jgi:hypothetical protein
VNDKKRSGYLSNGDVNSENLEINPKIGNKKFASTMKSKKSGELLEETMKR